MPPPIQPWVPSWHPRKRRRQSDASARLRIEARERPTGPSTRLQVSRLPPTCDYPGSWLPDCRHVRETCPGNWTVHDVLLGRPFDALARTEFPDADAQTIAVRDPNSGTVDEKSGDARWSKLVKKCQSPWLSSTKTTTRMTHGVAFGTRGFDARAGRVSVGRPDGREGPFQSRPCQSRRLRPCRVPVCRQACRMTFSPTSPRCKGRSEQHRVHATVHAAGGRLKGLVTVTRPAILPGQAHHAGWQEGGSSVC